MRRSGARFDAERSLPHRDRTFPETRESESENMHWLHLSASLLALLIALSGCPDPCADAEPPEIGEFSVDPADPAAGDTVTVTLDLHHFSLTGHGDEDEGHHDDEDEGHHDDDAACNAGHVHVYLDDLEGDLLAMIVTETADLDIPSSITSGAHTLIARLQGEDHAAVVPEVTASFEITVP